MPGALAGLSVLDLTSQLSGPYCSMILADLGADVVKVERPEGDDARRWGPPFWKDTSPGFLAEGEETTHERMKEKIMDEMKRAFRPEFINRIDDIIVFHALSREHITAIVQLMITRINTQLADKSIQLEPTGAALDLLVQKGYDPTYGARQLRRTIQKYVEDPVAEAIVRGQFAEGARIEVDVEGGNFVFREVQVAEPRLVLAER